MSRRSSVILVTVDCLRADHTGFLDYDRPTTPFLDSIVPESFIFPVAIVAGAPTYYSLPALLASRYPLALGRDVVGLAPEETNLASTLKQAGYATAFFGAGNPYISSRFGYNFGFDTFRDFLDSESVAPFESRPLTASTNGWFSGVNRKLRRVTSHLGPVASVYDELYFHYCQRVTPCPKSLDTLRRFPAADVIVDMARSWITSIGDTPFFLWLHFMDPHSPYYPTEKALALMAHEPIEPFNARYLNSYWNRSDLSAKRLARHRADIIALYDAGIRWVDAQIARLVESLKRFGLWDRCILAFTADHGEEFLDHGGRYHPPTRLMEELIRVPLLLRVPGTLGARLNNSPFSLLHLAPTLLQAAGVDVPAEFHGRSHWNALRTNSQPSELAISESVASCTNPWRAENRMGARTLSIREFRFKLAINFETRTENLFDLEADPGERAPLPLTAEKSARRRLLELAREHLQQSMNRRDLRARVRSKVRDLRIRALGPAEKWPAQMSLAGGSAREPDSSRCR